MSSWGQILPLQNRLKLADLFCKISKSGYGTNFQKFLMCYMFSQSLKKKLYLCDTTNNISESFHLILDTFAPIQGVEYTNKKGYTIFEDKIMQLNTFLCSLTEEFICSEARRVFKYSTKITEKINRIIEDAAIPKIHLGIHIRMGDKIVSGEMQSIALDVYISAINDAINTLGVANPKIYIMTDNSDIIPIIKAKCEPTWTFYSIPSPIYIPGGHDQLIFNKLPLNDKMSSYYHFLSELHIMQRCDYIICTYSSNIGRFLHMTREPNTIIKSLDTTTFTILHDMDIFLANSNQHSL